MTQLPIAIFLASSGGVLLVSAATPLPLWYPGPDTTRQGYNFDTVSLTPPPNVVSNPYGTPLTTITLGTFSDGWQEPGNLPPPAVNDTNGVAYDGAYDLGISGTVITQLAFASTVAAPGTYYRVYFQVYTVAYFGITALPAFNPVALSPTALVRTQSFVANDPYFPGATWQGVRWTGYFDNVTSNSLTLGITAPVNNTTIVDTFEVFTRFELIPETSSSLLALGSAVVLMIRRRRI